MAQIHGNCDPRFDEVKALAIQYLDSGDELGLSICVNIDGTDVVDMWGGYIELDHEHPWQRDTIVNVWSTTKTISSLAVLLLIDEGLVRPTDKVATYWPEFGNNCKEAIEVRHICSHTSGVPGWEKPITLAEICDFDYACKQLETQTPWWEPGTASGYHAFTHGHLIGKLVRCVTGKTLREFVESKLAVPLGADFQLGVTAEVDLKRVSDLVPFESWPQDPEKPPTEFAIRLFDKPLFTPGDSNTKVWRDAELGGANGHGNARSVAKIMSMVALGGEVDGVRILKPETIDLIFQEQATGKDLVGGMNMRYGMGFGIRGEGTDPEWLPQGRICFWGGLGGSVIIMDLDRKMTIAYAMNKMWPVGLGSHCTRAYVEAVYRALEK